MKKSAATRQKLLEAAQHQNFKDLIDLLHKHDSKRSSINLSETLAELSRVQQEELWGYLVQTTTHHLTLLLDNTTEDDDLRSSGMVRLLESQEQPEGRPSKETSKEANQSKVPHEPRTETEEQNEPCTRPNSEQAKNLNNITDQNEQNVSRLNAEINQEIQNRDLTVGNEQSTPQAESRRQGEQEVEEPKRQQQQQQGGGSKTENDDEMEYEKVILVVLKLAHLFVSSQKKKKGNQDDDEGDEEEDVPRQLQEVPDKFLELAGLVHGVLPALEKTLQVAVVYFLEAWWLGDLPAKEEVISNVLPVLLGFCMANRPHKTNVKRLWALHRAFDLIDLLHPSNAALVDQLVTCVATPIFLSCDEGLRFITWLFGMEELVPKLHQRVKEVLPKNSKNQCAKLANVYYRAWKSYQGEQRKMMEENCLQDLMYHAVHVDPTMGRLSANLHLFLAQIHSHKKETAVSVMLSNLYEPFLWRSLKVANGYVRMNAGALLCDLFPLCGPKENLQQEKSELMDRQMNLLLDLLLDPNHLVRCTMIQGVCSILQHYWIVLPSWFIKDTFQKLLSHLLVDASSAKVRSCVIKGVTQVLECAAASVFMKEVLPRMKDSFDDVDQGVRVDFVKLLLRVKTLKLIRYWEVVPMEHILHRLEVDCPAVCKVIVDLIFNSFHPTQRDDQEILHRCIALIRENRAASRSFYSYIYRRLDMNQSTRFLLNIWRNIKHYVINCQENEGNSTFGSNTSHNSLSSSAIASPGSTPKRSAEVEGRIRSRQTSNTTEEDKENSAPPKTGTSCPSPAKARSSAQERSCNQDSPLDDPVVILGLLDTIVIVWTTNVERLAQPQNHKFIEALRSRIAKTMPRVLQFFKEEEEIMRTLIYLSSFLPCHLVPTLVSHCLSRLRAATLHSVEPDTYNLYVDALCNWNRFDDLLELISHWIQPALTSTVQKRECSSAGRRVRFFEQSSPQPLLALQLLRQIMQHPLNKIAALHNHSELLLQLSQTLEHVKDLLEARLQSSGLLSELCSDDFLLDCWERYLRLVAILHHRQENEGEGQRSDFDSADILCQSTLWASRILVPLLEEKTETKDDTSTSSALTPAREKRKEPEDEQQPQVLAESAMQELVAVGTNLVMAGYANTQFVHQFSLLLQQLLTTECAYMFLVDVVDAAREIHEYLRFYDLDALRLEPMDSHPAHLLEMGISTFAQVAQDKEGLDKETKQICESLRLALKEMIKCGRKGIDIVTSHTVALILDAILPSVNQRNCLEEEYSLESLGLGVASLLRVFTHRSIAPFFMDQLADTFNTVPDVPRTLAAMQLTFILSQRLSSVGRPALKHVVVRADQLISSLAIPTVEQDSPFIANALSCRDLLCDMKSRLGVI
ncbi:condensin-2 complex subunit G2-like isoform X2 [Oratosquilla oratoria]|uniref:condensin-2 complex subunit G2-like isoform X2 n=1 Tax=Oratosquilla oratoria TaxID=337810 RepID=UPI003F760CD4